MQKNSVVAGAFALISGTGLAQAIGLLALPILTRLYTPEDFGLFAVYTSILSLGTVIVCLRYELAVVLPKTSRAALLVLRVCMWASLIVCLLMALVIFFAEKQLIAWYDLKGQAGWLWLIPFSLLAGGLYKAAIFWHTRNKHYKKLAVAKLSQSLPQTATQLALGFAAFGIYGLIAGEILGKLSALFSLSVGRGTKAVKTTASLQRLKKMTCIYKKFPLVSSWSAFINQLGVIAPALFIAAYFNAEVAGWYALAQRTLAVPMDLIGQSILSLYIGEASELLRTSPEKLKGLFFMFLSRMFVLGFIPVLVIVLMGDWLFSTVLGQQWAEAAIYAKVLVFAFWFRFAISPLSQTLNMLERQDIQFVWDLGRLLLVIGGFYLAVLFKADEITVLIIYTAIIIVAQTAYAAITYTQLNRLKA
jgi:O-antigen/teichoic acid export membrane protein